MAEYILNSKQDIMNLRMENIPSDSYWDLGSGTERGIHRIHAYPAKFPSFIPTKAIDYAKKRGNAVSRISDIFCGCGTVALEAKIAGIDFWGCDINPVATMIAGTKSTVYDKNKLELLFLLICQQYEDECGKHCDAYQSGNERLKYWYLEKQYCDLDVLIGIIRRIEDGIYRRAFECIFSSILKATSTWLTKSIKPQKDPQKRPDDVYTAFKEKFKIFCKVMLPKETPDSLVQIETENYLVVQDAPVADLIVTSPPYVTSYEYADLHQLSALWLGYAEDYKSLRAGTIGSMTPDEGNYLPDIALNDVGQVIIERMEAHSVPGNKTRAVKRYYMDMQRTARKSYEMLSKDGMAFFIIGDTEYKGVKILNCKHLSASLIDAGYRQIRISKRHISGKILTPYRNSAGKFSNDKNSRQVYHEEYVVIGHK